jgi:hypothetical protein
MTTILNWVALLLVLVATTALLLSRDWRWSIGLLAVQYLGAFWLLQSPWPISMAAAKLVTGWMACAVLGITLSVTAISSEEENQSSWPQNRLFRLFTAVLIFVVTFALALRAVTWLGLSLPVAWGGLVLLGLGIVSLGVTVQPFRVVLGLLTALTGFEVLYAAVESSTLVAAFLSVITLGLSLAGAYFLNTLDDVAEETG